MNQKLSASELLAQLREEKKIKDELRVLKKWKHSEEKRITHKEYIKQYNQKIDNRLKSYINRANKKQIVFELKPEEFENIIEQDCVYCGRQGGTIDRIDSTRGYISNNVQSCCLDCNRMKMQLSDRKFLEIVEMIYEKHFK